MRRYRYLLFLCVLLPGLTLAQHKRASSSEFPDVTVVDHDSVFNFDVDANGAELSSNSSTTGCGTQMCQPTTQSPQAANKPERRKVKASPFVFTN